METVRDRIAGILVRHPLPVMTLDQLCRFLRTEGSGARRGAAEVERLIRGETSQFRLRRARTPVWEHLFRPRGPSGPMDDAYGRALVRAGIPQGPWVVGEVLEAAAAGLTGRRIRESMVGLGMSGEGDAASEVARWNVLAREADRTLTRLRNLSEPAG